MHRFQNITQLLLAGLLALTAGIAVNANLASGVQDLAADLSPGETTLNLLLPQGKTEANTMQALGFLVVPKRRVLLDSNVVTELRANPTLSGRIRPGEVPVVSNVARPELRNAVSTGSLRGVPRALDDLPVANLPSSLNTRINIRGQLPSGRGRFGDGVTGAQALENNIPLITNDRALRGVVQSLGGTVR